MLVFPNCKINLGLHVTGKRTDGYHDIRTVFYPVPLTDCLEIVPSGQLTFSAYGIPIPGAADDNICLKAYHLLSTDLDLPPVAIHLLKNIPTGAGLGGGSADAAFMLKALNEMFRLRLNASQLASYALQLGSDCPFFIENRPCIAEGRGERLSRIDIDLGKYFILIVRPDIHIPTAWAYAGVRPVPAAGDLRDIVKGPPSTWPGILTNDFEAVVFDTYPRIRGIKEELYETGAVYASLSGSGSAVFGIFSEKPETASLFRDCFTRLIEPEAHHD